MKYTPIYAAADVFQVASSESAISSIRNYSITAIQVTRKEYLDRIKGRRNDCINQVNIELVSQLNLIDLSTLSKDPDRISVFQPL